MRLPAPIRATGRALDRVVRSVWVERVGGGLLVGGLVWGFLKLAASNFPTAPLIVATVGAFLLAARLTPGLVQRVEGPPRQMSPPSPSDAGADANGLTAFRKRLLFVKSELETIAHRVGGLVSPWYWEPLPDTEWQQARDYLAGVAGFAEAYSEIHDAYLGADQANRLAERAQELERNFDDDERDTIDIAGTAADRAIRVVQEYLDILEGQGS
jgi:hypothetical protein